MIVITELAAMAAAFPTIMDIRQEIFLIRELEKLPLTDIGLYHDQFLKIVDQLDLSHTGGGLFEVTRENETVFTGFAAWLLLVEKETGWKLSHFAADFNMTYDDIANAMRPG